MKHTDLSGIENVYNDNTMLKFLYESYTIEVKKRRRRGWKWKITKAYVYATTVENENEKWRKQGEKRKPISEAAQRLVEYQMAI